MEERGLVIVTNGQNMGKCSGQQLTLVLGTSCFSPDFPWGSSKKKGLEWPWGIAGFLRDPCSLAGCLITPCSDFKMETVGPWGVSDV